MTTDHDVLKSEAAYYSFRCDSLEIRLRDMRAERDALRDPENLARAMFISQAENQGMRNADMLWRMMRETGQVKRWLDEAADVIAVLERVQVPE